MKYHLHTLPNGLRIVLSPMPETESATVFVMTGTGSRYENERENGLAHFLEHMFFKGTKKRRSAKAISEELDAVGAVYNAFTAKDRTAYYAKVASKYLDTAFDVITDIFLNSTLPQKEIEKERGAIIQEIDMYEDMPMHTVDNVFDALLYGPEHPLGRTILGPKENIRAFKRADFAAYHKRNYNAANTVVAIAGAFDEKKMLLKIRKVFGHLKPATAPECLAFAGSQKAPRIAIKEKKTDQTHLMLGVPAYPYLHKDEYVLSVLAAILGGGMSSRLFLEVREKRGLAYSISAWNEKYPDTGHFVVQAGVEHGKLEETVKVVLQELKKIKAKKVPVAEFKKIKTQFEGGAALALETSNQVAGGAASSMLSVGRVRTLEETLKGIEAVTREDVQRVARDLFKTEKLNLAIIGPHANAKELIALLRL
jgi:predicted Zn-dependent peptidase